MHRESKTVPGMPRRAVMDEWTLEERKIFDLIQDIEKLGGSPALTKCVILLSDAKDQLSNHLELIMPKFEGFQGAGCSVHPGAFCSCGVVGSN